MSTLQIPITSNAAEILRQLQGAPARMLQAIAQGMDRENELTTGHIQAKYLTGPRPGKLGVITNRLRGSIRPSRAVVNGTTVNSSIGTNVVYAGVHERGFTGKVTVRSFTRRNPRGNVQATGAVMSMKTGRISRRQKVTQLASGISTVRSFTRNMRMPARPFLAPGVADRAEAYGKTISAAIIAAWQGGAQ